MSQHAETGEQAQGERLELGEVWAWSEPHYRERIG